MSKITVTELSGHAQIEISGRSAVLLRDYHIELVVNGKHRVIIVPAGTVTDFASSPPLLWGLFPPIGQGITEASIVHDYLYRHPGIFTRADCDEIFYQIMLAMGTRESRVRSWGQRLRQEWIDSKRKARARIGYWGVRVGGWKPWNEYRLDEI